MLKPIKRGCWRVFWVPRDAVRGGVRRSLLGRWQDLPAREDAVGVRAGDAIFLSPDYRVDPLLSLYGQSNVFRAYTSETKRNYATDIALLLTFLWSRGRRAANRVRVTVQLVDARNGFQIWSERYDRQMEDIFEVQDEIASAIAERLKV